MNQRTRRRLTLLLVCLAITVFCVSCFRACFVMPKERVIRQFYAHQESFDTIAEFVSGYDKSAYGVPPHGRTIIFFFIWRNDDISSRAEKPYSILLARDGEDAEIEVRDPAILQALDEILCRQKYKIIDEPGFENQCIYFWARCTVIDQACGVVYTKDGEKIREAFGIPVTYTERLDDHWFYWEGDHSDGR